MSRELSKLLPEFREHVEGLLDDCEASGYPMRPFFTVRTPFEQARLWRQSRSTRQIHAKLAELEAAGASFLACAQHGRTPAGGSPATSWSRRVKRSATAEG